MDDTVQSIGGTSPAERVRLRHHLEQFVQMASVRTAVIASVDGFTLACVGGTQATGDRLAAMTSAMLGLAGAITRELALGELAVLMIDAADGKVLMVAIPVPGRTLLLMATCPQQSVAGNVLWNAKQCGRNILAEFGGP